MPVNATIVVPEQHAEAAKELLRETQEAHESAGD
jgi:hypothetical protein